MREEEEVNIRKEWKEGWKKKKRIEIEIGWGKKNEDEVKEWEIGGNRINKKGNWIDGSEERKIEEERIDGSKEREKIEEKRISIEVVIRKMERMVILDKVERKIKWLEGGGGRGIEWGIDIGIGEGNEGILKIDKVEEEWIIEKRDVKIEE